ncbi:unnamed protein product [Linum trigynum]|uniref:Uncharacterized protein n=1 Tax=Linum trigynum TaxID=586398 RepID=A0AAV2CM18_9ROSI
MKKKLEAACQGANVKLDDVAMVLDGLLLEYEVVVSPGRCHQLSLTKSVLGPIFEYFKKLIDNVSSEKDALLLRCCTVEEKAGLLLKKLEASEKLKSEYQSRYEDAVKDMNNLSHHYKKRMSEMESNCRSIEDKCSSLLEMLDGVKQESLDWKLKYEESFTNRKDFDDRNYLKEKVSDPRPRDVSSKFSRAGKQAWCPEPKPSANEAQMAFEEARQWKDKYDLAVNESKDAMEKAEAELKLLADQTKLREGALRVEFSNSLAKKDEEIKDTMMKLEDAERRLNTLTSNLQVGEKRIQAYDLETSNLKLQFKELNDKYEFIKASAQSLENQAQMRLQEKLELEQKYLAESKRLEEIQARCKVAEEEVNVAQARLKEKAEVEQKYLAESKRLEEIQARCKVAEEEVNVAQARLKEKAEVEQKYLAESKRLEEIQARCKVAEEEVNVAQARLKEKAEVEQKYLAESKRLEEIQARCKVAEEEVNVAQARLKEKAEVEQKYLADLKMLRETHERCKSSTNESATARFEQGQYIIESDLTGKPVTLLEEMLKERNQEIDQWKSKCEQLSSSIQVVDDAVLESERDLTTSFDPESLEAKLHSIEQHLNSENANEDDEMLSEMKFPTPSKRTWSPELPGSFASPSQSMASDGGLKTEQQRKRQKTNMSLQKCTSTEVGKESALKVDSEAEDDAESRKPADSVVSYAKLTVARMRQELNDGGFGAELLKLKSKQKKDVYALYKKHVLKN